MDVLPAADWAGRLAALLEERDPGVLLGLTTLLLGIASRNYEGFEACVPRLVHILDRLKARDVPQDYTYYGLASPWLQVRALRVLQYFPPPEDPALLRALRDTIKRILAGNEQAKNPNKNNAVHAVVFEAVAVAVGLGDPELLTMGIGLLARFLTIREANLKYLALENLGRLSQAPEVAEAIGRHQKTIMSCLHDEDISIRRRALDLMFTTATATTAPAVVEELLAALPRADFSLREELVLKAAVLAERFPPSPEWYVDSMLKLMEIAGDATMDDVWHSVVQLVASDASLLPYAATKTLDGLKRGATSEVYIRCAAFVLAEHAQRVPGRADPIPMVEQFSLLHARFPAATLTTKAMMLTSYEKMRAASPSDADLASAVAEVMRRHATAPDAEIQQRAMEYTGFAGRPTAEAVAVQMLPPWEKRTSLLLRRLAEREGEGEEELRERPAWMQEESDAVKDTNGADAGDGIADSEKELGKEEGEELEKGVEQEEPQVPPPPPPPVPDLLDLLDLGEPTTSAEPSEEHDVTTPANGADPALAAVACLAVASPIANPFSEPAALSPMAMGGIQPLGSIVGWLHALYRSTSGILYEDVNVQVGVRMTIQSSTCQVGFYVGNKSGQVLENIVFTVPPNPAFALSLGLAPHVLEPGRQVLVPLEAVCLSSFTSLPFLQMGYTLVGGASRLAITLTLPLPVTKFCQPVDIPPSIFMTRWGQVAGAPFKLSQPLQTHATSSDVARLLSVLQLQVLDGVEDSPCAVCAACVFHCGVPQQTRQIPCMVKVEGLPDESGSVLDGRGATLTVATSDAMASDALKEVLAQQIQFLGL